MSAIVSVGSINADFEVRVPEPPAGAGTLLASHLLRTSGGKGANVAVLAHRLGVEAHLHGAVGDDDLAEQALAGPRREGLDLRWIRRVPGPTAFSSIAVGPDGDKAIVLALGANDAWGQHAEALASEVGAAPRGSVFVVDLEISEACVRAAVEAARRAGFDVVLDPAPPERLPDGLIAQVDHLTPDHLEARALTGTDTSSVDGAFRAARELRRRGAGAAYVKLATGGCAVSWSGGTHLVDNPDALRPVDTTGAGDAFAGALACSLLRGAEPPDAAAAAVAAANCAVSAYGSQESYPGPADLEEMRRRLSVTTCPPE